MNSYQWTILNMTVKETALGKTVTRVDYGLIVRDPQGVHAVDTTRSVELDIDNIENFTAYDQLTESQVIKWVKDSFTVETYAALLSELDRNLAQQVTAAAEQGRKDSLPWAPAWSKAQTIAEQWALEQAERAARDN